MLKQIDLNVVILDNYKKEKMPKPDQFLKGRGAQINPSNRFEDYVRDDQPVDWQEWQDEIPQIKTQIIEVHPKTIVNEVKSPDIPSPYSMNPYQGCEHGCVYCYARNSHEYWGYSAGLDFEQKILVKKNAAKLLAKKLKSKRWEAASIMLSGNTDCYQPVEKELGITREILETFWRYRHPVSIITKNSLVLRDLDILKELASERLVRVAISVTTLDEPLRQFLEPRTATANNRLKTIKTLSENGIPVFAMLSPIIPGLNDHEIFDLVKATSEAGAHGCGFTMVRLNGQVANIFEDWIHKTYPDRAEKVLNKIKESHGGKLEDSRFGTRMRGEGKTAEIIKSQFNLARKKFYEGRSIPKYNYELHKKFKSGQLSLFD